MKSRDTLILEQKYISIFENTQQESHEKVLLQYATPSVESAYKLLKDGQEVPNEILEKISKGNHSCYIYCQLLLLIKKEGAPKNILDGLLKKTPDDPYSRNTYSILNIYFKFCKNNQDCESVKRAIYYIFASENVKLDEQIVRDYVEANLTVDENVFKKLCENPSLLVPYAVHGFLLKDQKVPNQVIDAFFNIKEKNHPNKIHSDFISEVIRYNKPIPKEFLIRARILDQNLKNLEGVKNMLSQDYTKGRVTVQIA